jgi:8-oxo-dGTP pyrophosphatase MutT (NUDIX family)
VSSLAEPASPRVVPAAGGVVWRPAGEGIEVAVVHRPKYDDWSLPKGKLEEGEHALEAAVREVCEETGLAVVAGRRGASTDYPIPEGVKHVDYWLMKCVGGAFTPNAEVDELRWLPLAAAADLLTHPHDRTVLDDAARTDIPRAPTLLLVRHASAGSRHDFDGPDELRPLDARGRRQARRLAEVLPVFLPRELLTAGRVRCRQTLEPLAERMGLSIRSAPELGEEQFAADPEAGMALVERLLEPRFDHGVTVACSQGGAIPLILLSLGVRWEGVRRLHPPAAKGSVWALGGRPGRLAADYYRDFGG